MGMFQMIAGIPLEICSFRIGARQKETVLNSLTVTDFAGSREKTDGLERLSRLSDGLPIRSVLNCVASEQSCKPLQSV